MGKDSKIEEGLESKKLIINKAMLNKRELQ